MRAQHATVAVAVLALIMILTGCSGPGSGGPTTPKGPATSPGPAIRVVAVGDSDATGIGDETGRGWVGRYGTLLQHDLGRRVAVRNLAVEGRTSDQLRDAVSRSGTMRRTLAGADVILIGIGGADLNAGDEAWGAGTCEGRACYGRILAAFDANIAAVAKELRRLAPKALLRAMSLPNVYPGAGDAIPSSAAVEDVSRYQAVSERDSVCRAMRANGGRCVDVVRAFNGVDADGDAYATGLLTRDPCCYPSAKGQQAIARLLLATTDLP